MALQFWLIKDNTKYQFPVPPPEFSIQAGNQTQSVNIYALGELNLWGPEKLDALTIQSFFPDPSYDYPFCQCGGYPEPWDTVNMINEWRNSGVPLRLIITGTEINMLVLIEGFNYGVNDGTSNINFQLTLKKYKQVTTPSVDNTGIIINRPTPSNNGGISGGGSSQRTYTVVSGDNLTKISKRFYGTGSKWQTIYNANKDKISNPNLIYPGQVLVIP